MSSKTKGTLFQLCSLCFSKFLDKSRVEEPDWHRDRLMRTAFKKIYYIIIKCVPIGITV